MLCKDCRSTLDPDDAIQANDHNYYCEDCIDDKMVTCPACNGQGGHMGIVRATSMEPPEITCGMCDGCGEVPHAIADREVVITSEDIADMRADWKMDEMRDKNPADYLAGIVKQTVGFKEGT